MNKPKFCVGEEVKLDSASLPEENRFKVEIRKSRYFKGKFVYELFSYDGWVYQVKGSKYWWVEGCLTKLIRSQHRPPKYLSAWNTGATAH